jgi:crotonobetainyl-CoA:carnitine CoA-transferase CaiB-like acyl-CoA transferase
VAEVLADPQLAHRGALAEVQDKGGSFKVVNPPFRFSSAPVQVSNFSATLGQHTREILESAGYAEEEIGKMSAAGIVVLEQ